MPKGTITARKFRQYQAQLKVIFKILGGSLYGLIFFAEFKLLLNLLNSETKRPHERTDFVAPGYSDY